MLGRCRKQEEGCKMNVPDEVVVWQKAYLAWGAEVHKKMSEARDLAYELS